MLCFWSLSLPWFLSFSKSGLCLCLYLGPVMVLVLVWFSYFSQPWSDFGLVLFLFMVLIIVLGLVWPQALTLFCFSFCLGLCLDLGFGHILCLRGLWREEFFLWPYGNKGLINCGHFFKRGYRLISLKALCNNNLASKLQL